jgi:aryl-alcohol dehydrogenase-like predicted oxidoreductase
MNTPNPLEIKQLGKTHMNVTAVSLGGAGLGGIFGPVGDDEGVAAVERALELGINYLDTSPKYGQAERRMGRWTVERSLEVLGIDVLDLCHIHEPELHHLDQALAPGGALEALVDLKEQGVIRAIGIGVQDHEAHRRAIETGHIDVSMMVNDYTLLRQDVDDMFSLAQERGIGLVNGAALAMGLLSGRAPDSIGTQVWTPPAAEVRAAQEVTAWCERRGISVLSLALQFSLRQEAFDCTLIGAANATEVSGCWDALQAEIPDDVWAEIPQLLDAVRTN